MKDLLKRVELMLMAGADINSIREILIQKEGLTETQAFYTYIGAKICFEQAMKELD